MDALLSEQIKRELANFGVAVLYLYGSRAQGTSHENSDFDVGIVFADPKQAHLDIDRYGTLYNILSSVFPDTLRGPKLDIAILQRANARLQLDAIQHGLVIFESEPRVRADYEESVIKRYDDYRFLEREYEDATFAAFSVPTYV